MSYSKEEEEILAFLRSEQESYYRGDFEAFVDHWHHGPEVRRTIAGPQVGTRVHVGWDHLRSRFEEGLRQFPQNFDARKILRWDNVQIQLTHDMAWVTYDQVVLKHIPGLHASPLSHETKIVQRFDGAWKLICLVVVAPGLGREDTPRIELDGDGQVASINALARRTLSSSGLVISNQHLKARNRTFDSGLQLAIERNKSRLATNLPRGFLNEQAIAVPLGEDESCHATFCWVTCEQERILISFDDDVLLRARLEQAAHAFSLSPAQLKLSELISSGHDLNRAGEALGVTVNTVRTQVRRMFEKTGTGNQAELLSRLLAFHAPD